MVPSPLCDTLALRGPGLVSGSGRTLRNELVMSMSQLTEPIHFLPYKHACSCSHIIIVLCAGNNCCLSGKMASGE